MERLEVSVPVVGPEAAEDLALLRALLDKAALAVAVVDAEGRLRMTSRGLQRLVGVLPIGAPASKFPRLFHIYNAAGTELLRPEDVPISRALTGETVGDVVVSIRPPGRPVRYLRCNAAPLLTAEGDCVGAMTVVADVTSEHLAVSRQDAIRRLLVDTVNHELRTPLTAVLANAELLADIASDLPAEVREPLSSIARSSAALRETLQHVSDLVDLEGVTRAAPSEHKVGSLLEATGNRFWYQAQQRQITIKIECPPSLTWCIDLGLTMKGLAALVDNAITHGPTHSVVTLAARVDGEVLRLSVTDQGQGIAPEDGERLTLPFERGLTHLASPHAQGLGLPIAHAVTTCQQGGMSFTTKPDGFTVSMVLP